MSCMRTMAYNSSCFVQVKRLLTVHCITFTSIELDLLGEWWVTNFALPE